jgi:predicted peroxiredoxin
MANLLFVGTHATDDPTKAALPFVSATGTLANKIDVAIALLAEAPYLMNDEIAKAVLQSASSHWWI